MAKATKASAFRNISCAGKKTNTASKKLNNDAARRVGWRIRTTPFLERNCAPIKKPGDTSITFEPHGTGDSIKLCDLMGKFTTSVESDGCSGMTPKSPHCHCGYTATMRNG